MAVAVERAGHAVVVREPGADEQAVAYAAALAPEPDRTSVVVGESAREAVSRLDPWVVADLDDHVGPAIRLHTPAHPADGVVPLARRLADRLGMEVTAPDGDLVTLPDGHAFAPTGWTTHGDDEPRPAGKRFPEPPWQADLPDDLPATVEEIPVGLWIRATTAPRPADPIRQAVPDPDRPTLVVGAPGEPTPTPRAVANVLRRFPDDVRVRTVLTHYGERDEVDIAQAVAFELRAAVRMRHGAPVRPTWEPFVVESVYRPACAPVVDRWSAPVTGLAQTAPARYRLAPGWSLDVIARGLLARPDTTVLDAALNTPTGPYPELLVAADELPAPVFDALCALVADLPADLRATLLVIAATPGAVKATRALAERLKPPTKSERAPSTITIDRDGVLSVIELPDDVDPSATARVSRDQVAALERTPGDPAVTTRVRQEEASAAKEFRRSFEAATGARSTRLGDQLAVAPATTRGSQAPLPPLHRRPSEPPATRVRREEAARRSTDSETATRVSRDQVVSLTRAEPAPPVIEPLPDLPQSPQRPPTGLPLVTTAKSAAPTTSAPPPLTETASATAGDVFTPRPVEVKPPVPTKAPAVTAAPTPTKVPSVVPAGAVSTEAQRRQVRAALGTRYDSATQAVVRLLAERPGLRAAGEHAALVTELAVVRVFAEEPGSYDTAFHTCLAAGLRRLPTWRGVVVRGAERGERREGELLNLPEPMLAVATVGAAVPGDVELLIWSATARRLDGLLDDDRGHDVVLPAHTALRVLAVEADRVLLAEDGAPVERALTALRAAAEARSAVEIPHHPDAAHWFGALPAA
ncbi:hypothetical protein V5P93_002779 [Actinokineospora auranticolor]|uniref:Uncharacterized protein n=1 Tax=Actinokineospora auranticolor TaxID=155976 RepID=A0A2S6H0J1_9PSEU|nr:hypothetical protein [Actinokineospora auranticolor]PPK70920.1 hypothetical protein CLV40_101106 [Actinokineospora auranticolor]